MPRPLLAPIFIAAVAATASAQTPTATPAELRLAADDAVKMALENNVDLAADRLDPQISDALVAAAMGAFRPAINSTVQRNSQLLPPQSFLIPTPTRTDVVTSSAGVSQRLRWGGASYSVAWSATLTDSDSVLNSYNPLVQSGLSISFSQPLGRDRVIDLTRQQLAASRINRAVAETRLRESVVHTTANVRTAYWNLVSAVANVDARRSALDLAQELARVNKAKVDVGAAPPLDLVSAQAEVASDQEQLIVAETAVQEAEDRLRLLIFDPTDRSTWNVRIEPTDSPPVGTSTPDLDRAVANALGERADLDRARREIETRENDIAYAENQRLPDVRFNASYLAAGLGGTQILRAGGFPGAVIGVGQRTDFGSILNQLLLSKYPTWTAALNLSYPIGTSAEDAHYARAKLEQSQAEQRLKSAEARAIQQVRDAGRKIEMNAKRIETARAARELADQRLDAERKRLDVGMSTSFLVIQAQRDLAQAKTNELAAVLAYNISLVDFEALQRAGPANQAGSASPAASSLSSQLSVVPRAATATAPGTVANGASGAAPGQ